MAGCRFCDLAGCEDPDVLVYDSDGIAAFLDHRPVFHGHVLVVPVTHYETLADLPPGLMAPLLGAVQTVMAAQQLALANDGSFVAANNRVSQSVAHLHVHVVPRRFKDGLRGFFWPRHPYDSDEERAAMHQRLRDAVEAVVGE